MVKTMYIPIEFNGVFAATGSLRHPKRDVMYLINNPCIFGTCWERAIKKCFRKAGILCHDFSVVSPLIPAASDLFSDIDSCDLDESGDCGCEELAELIHRIHGPENACSVSELLASESEIPVCSEFAASTWDEDFMTEIGPQSKGFCEHGNKDLKMSSPLHHD